jgi:hypothetical protein
MDHAHNTLRSVKYTDEHHRILYNDWNLLDESSLCCISGVRMSGWQFFPGERFRQSNEIIDVPFTEPEEEILQEYNSVLTQLRRYNCHI